MLKRIDNNRILSLNSAREQYPKSKILFLITDMSDMSDIQGTVFMVSDDNTSFNELCDENDKLKEQGKEGHRALLMESQPSNVYVGNFSLVKF